MVATGTCEVARIEDVPCILLEKESTLEPLMKEQVSYLPEQHTIELDSADPAAAMQELLKNINQYKTK